MSCILCGGATTATASTQASLVHTAVVRTHKLQLSLERRGYPIPITPYKGHVNAYTLHEWRVRRWHLYLYNAFHPYTYGWLLDALCVHRGEGSWTDPDAPYWGGLQMDMSFQASYGPEWLSTLGTADHWEPYKQLIAGYRAWLTRGWCPWPVTSVNCGL